MAITQVSKIEVRTGELQDLPQLSVGEFGFAVSPFPPKLFIGTNNGNVTGPMPLNVEVLTQFSSAASNAPPATPTSPGFAGQLAYDASHLYVCIAPDTWRRTNLVPWT